MNPLITKLDTIYKPLVKGSRAEQLGLTPAQAGRPFITRFTYAGKVEYYGCFYGSTIESDDSSSGRDFAAEWATWNADSNNVLVTTV
ncbi:hypothetical protein [Vibrio algicola]|uniref:Uncharacterized protein n=1 Tax=Vibrio algicola TaxID=2662262 RepID=A0A5Q0TI70_9VIBR|nr:hypothetical protein [Vibrio algicola]